MSDNKSAQIIPLESRSAASQNTNSESVPGVGDVFQGIISGLPDKPDNLKPDESRFWDEIGEKLVASGVLSEVDLSAFHRYVVSYCEWRRWNDLCQENYGLGAIQTYQTGAKALSVEAVLRKQAADELRKLEQQFGLTPRARQAIKIENPDQGTLDL
jgi:P27 family predicted phage terminase small subunit